MYGATKEQVVDPFTGKKETVISFRQSEAAWFGGAETMTSQKFGGDWTAKKLNFFTSYLDAYLIALQNQKFKKIYIDAFAGTGEIETSDGEAYLAGSAKRALSAERRLSLIHI